MDREAEGCREALRHQLADGDLHRMARRDHVVGQHRAPPAEGREPRHVDRHLAIAMARLAQGDVRDAGGGPDGGDPLLALLVRPHEKQACRVLSQMRGKNGCRMADGHGHGVDVAHCAVAMEMRVDGGDPVEAGGQQTGEGGGRDGLALAEALVLPHIGEVRRHEADAGCSKLPQGRGREEQWQCLFIRRVQRTAEGDGFSGHRRHEAQIGFAIGEMAMLHVALLRIQQSCQGGGQHLVARQGEDRGRHHASPSAMISGWARA